MVTPNGTLATVTTQHSVWGNTVTTRYALVPNPDDESLPPVVYYRILRFVVRDAPVEVLRDEEWRFFGQARLLPGVPLDDALFAYVYYKAFPDNLTRVDERTWGTWCPDHKEDINVNEDDRVFICHECGGDVPDDETVHVLNRPFHVECAPNEDEDDVTSDPAWHPACPDCNKESN